MKVARALCCGAFLYQVILIIKEMTWPTLTNTDITETKLKNYPFVIKICPEPAFKKRNAVREGYRYLHEYFLGRSGFNESIYGWAGHQRKNLRAKKTVEDVYKSIIMYEDIHDLLFE